MSDAGKTPKFGFLAEFHSADYDGDDEGWKVFLPHQCDEWTITAKSAYEPPVSREVAVERLAAFIREAQACLDALRTRSEYRSL